MLGEPAFVRHDPPARYWQYRPDGCALDLFLYEDATGTAILDHLASRATRASGVGLRECLGRVIHHYESGNTG